MGRSSINVKRLTMWNMTADGESATTYDATAYAFTNELNSIKYTPTIETNSQYGDGIKVEDYVAKDGGDIEAVIRGFKSGDSAFLFGETETTTENTAVSSSDDIVPYVCVAYATERPDGKLNLYKFPKVKWMPQGEDNQQREGSKVSYATASLKGTYSPLLSTHADSYKCYGVDPDSELVENWFTTADYYTADSST